MSTEKMPVVKPAFKDWNHIDDGRLEHRDYDTNHSYVSQYGPEAGCAGQWFWNVQRGNAELHSILPSVEEAVERINVLLAMPIEGFIDEAAAVIVDEIETRMKKLAAMDAGDKIDGYRLGFETGFHQGQSEIKESVLKLFQGELEGRAA